MIMAGRGRRLTDCKDEPRKVGMLQVTIENTPADMPSLTKKINEINTSDINLSLLNIIEKIVERLFTSGDVMKDVISKLHSKSLDDVEFGEKLIVALEHVSSFEVEGTNVRNVLLSLIQSDFNIKHEVSNSNPKRFVNSVMLLGHVFNRIKVCGKPISILALALIEYFDLLLQGDEEELKTVVKQILINGTKLTEQDNYKQLLQNLRNTLITRNLNSSSKCWILLAIEFTSNGFQHLKEGAKDFYVTNLGDEFTKLESYITVQKDQAVLLPLSPGNVKSQDGQDSGSWRAKKLNTSPNEANNFKKDLHKNFSDMSIKPGGGKKVQSPPGKNHKKDIWKSGGGTRQGSEHDDRFEKEENFYGVQRPCQPKPENQSQKKISSVDKTSKKEFEHFKTDLVGEVKEAQTKEEESRNRRDLTQI